MIIHCKFSFPIFRKVLKHWCSTFCRPQRYIELNDIYDTVFDDLNSADIVGRSSLTSSSDYSNVCETHWDSLTNVSGHNMEPIYEELELKAVDHNQGKPNFTF